MHRRLPRVLSAALALTAIAALSACSSAPAPVATSATPSDGLNFVLITPTAVEPGTFLQFAVDGVSTAAAKLNASLEILEPSASVSVQDNIDAAMLENPTVIIGLTDGVLTEFDYTAASNLAHQFLLIDSAALEPTGNLSAALFRDYEADYLAGVEAGVLATGKKSVAVVSPFANPLVQSQSVPFLTGAASQDDSLKIGITNVGTEEASTQAEADDAAAAAKEAGAKIVQPIGFGPSTTLLGAAPSDDFLTFGHHFDQCAVSPGHVIDSTINRVDVVAELALQDVLDGTTGLITSYGLAEGAVSLASLEGDSDCTVTESPEVLAAVATARDAIIAGDIVVGDPTYADPSLQPQP